MDVNKYMDYTNLDFVSTSEQISKLCEEAIKYGINTVCVFPYYVGFVKEGLKKTNIHVETVIGYPSGMSTPKTKSFEAIEAIELGADEIVLVMNHSAIKEQDYDYIKQEIEEVRDSIDGRPLTILVDCHILKSEQIKKIIQICNDTFVHYIELKGDNEKIEKNIEIVMKNKSDIVEVKLDCNQLEDLLKWREKGVKRFTIHDIKPFLLKEVKK